LSSLLIALAFVFQMLTAVLFYRLFARHKNEPKDL